jgi:tRNA-specific 2-thiouridylase
VAVGEPRFVIRIDAGTATVVVGSREELAVGSARLHEITWSRGSGGDGPVMAQYRAHGDPVPAWIEGSTLTFDDPQEAVSPGQTVAFYDGDAVLGGALIASTG